MKRRAGAFDSLLAPTRRRGFGPVAQEAVPGDPGGLLVAPGSGTQDTDRVVLLALAGHAAG